MIMMKRDGLSFMLVWDLHADLWGNAAANLSLTNVEVLVAVVDDVVLWAACSDEAQTLKQTRNAYMKLLCLNESPSTQALSLL